MVVAPSLDILFGLLVELIYYTTIASYDFVYIDDPMHDALKTYKISQKYTFCSNHSSMDCIIFIFMMRT